MTFNTPESSHSLIVARELYDMRKDPEQNYNLLAEQKHVTNQSVMFGAISLPIRSARRLPGHNWDRFFCRNSIAIKAT